MKKFSDFITEQKNEFEIETDHFKGLVEIKPSSNKTTKNGSIKRSMLTYKGHMKANDTEAKHSLILTTHYDQSGNVLHHSIDTTKGKDLDKLLHKRAPKWVPLKDLK